MPPRSPSRRLSAPAVAVLLGTAAAQPPAGPPDLRVLRATPADTAGPAAEVTFTLDRAVRLTDAERAADAARLVRVDPAAPVRARWADPTTLRVTPAEPLAAGRRYTVTLLPGLRAVDGGRLRAPARATFTVRAPAVVAASPAMYSGGRAELPPGGVIRLVYDAPVPAARLASARLVFSGAAGGGDDPAPCLTAGAVPLTVAARRPARPGDPGQYGRPGRESLRGSERFRTYVELRPAVALPDACAGVVELPAADPRPGAADAAVVRYAATTAPAFALARVALASDPGDTALVEVAFTAPVRPRDARARLRFDPERPFEVVAPMGEGWPTPVLRIRTTVRPRAVHRVAVDSLLRDTAGRVLTGARARDFTAGGRRARIGYDVGLISVAGDARAAGGGPTLRLRHVNVPRVALTVYAVPDSLRARVLGGATAAQLQALGITPGARAEAALRGPIDAEVLTAVPVPRPVGAPAGALLAVDVQALGTADDSAAADLAEAPGAPRRASEGGARPRPGVPALDRPVALLQPTGLALHLKAAAGQGGLALVTRLADGAPVAGARVTLYDSAGRADVAAVTGADGVARLPATAAPSRFDAPAATSPPPGSGRGRSPRGWREPPRVRGFAEAALGGDRVVEPALESRGGDALSPWALGADAGAGARPRAAVYADRGIYRPGEWLHVGAVVRDGVLGALRTPAGGRVRLRVTQAERGYGDEADAAVVRDTVLRLDAAGTASDSARLAPSLPLGGYRAAVLRWDGAGWDELAAADFRVAEYRAPEFRVALDADSAPRYLGDTVRARLGARYLFDAPMGGVRARWSASVTPADAWVRGALPGLGPEWQVGDGGYRPGREEAAARALPEDQRGEAVLDARGEARLTVSTPWWTDATPALVRIDASVTDLNRQTVTRSVSRVVHAADVYLAARDSAGEWAWERGSARVVRVLAVRPDGTPAPATRVQVAVVRYRYVPDTAASQPWRGRWVADTVARDSLRTAPSTAAGAADTARLRVVAPSDGGYAAVVLTARDERGRPARTVLGASVVGDESWWRWWRPGNTPVRLTLTPNRERAAAGDTVRVRFAAPFDAEAWVTVERERVLRSWRLAVAAGQQAVAVPMEAGDAPNVYVGVLLVRRGPARPDSALEARVRAGYAAVAVDPAPRRLAVDLRDARGFRYAPGDTARLEVRVRDAAGRPSAATVTLWAVDEGVLSLTDFARPRPLEALYAREGLGTALASSLARLGTARPPWRVDVAEERAVFASRIRGQSLRLSQVVVTGASVQAPRVGAPRSTFRTTAFFLGAVRAGADGVARARPVLPDNLTTFRLMAVAAADGDAYGDAESPLVTTRPLVVRAALPRFVRAGDSLSAGAVVTLRAGAAPRVLRARADADGLTALGPREQVAPAPAGAGAERRWAWRVPSAADTGVARVRLSATADTLADAVDVPLRVRPAYVPRAHAAAGVLFGRGARAEVRLPLPAELDPARSRLELQVGASPLPAVRAAWHALAAYPYDCTEQLASAGRALVALLRLRAAGAPAEPDDSLLAPRLQLMADAIAGRIRDDGGVGYWSRSHWTTAWLSAEAGLVLLDARALGADVDPSAVARIARFLDDTVDAELPRPAGDSAGAFGTRAEQRRAAARLLGGRLAAVEFLRRAERPRADAEEALLGASASLVWEDRARLARLLAAGGDAARGRALLDALWRPVERGGARADLPDSLLLGGSDFPSHLRPPARLLLATLALRPDHPRLGELAARLVQRQRADGRLWNTQDLSASAEALGALAVAGGWAPGRVRVVAPDGRVLAVADPGGAEGRTVTAPLAGLVAPAPGGRAGAQTLTVRVERAGPEGQDASAPNVRVGAFYALTVHEVPRASAAADAHGAAAGSRARDSRGLVVERWYERLADGRAVLAVAPGELVRVRVRVTAPAGREFVAVEDPLPAGLEPVDLTLRTSGTLAPFAPAGRRAAHPGGGDADDADDDGGFVGAGRCWWSPWEHVEQRDDAVRWYARRLDAGTYTLAYVARATTPGRFVRPPAHAEEMYNPALAGRTEGGRFSVAWGATAPSSRTPARTTRPASARTPTPPRACGSRCRRA